MISDRDHVLREQARKKVSFHESEEEMDTVAPLKNDVFAEQYDEHGNRNIYANRKQNKEEIRKQLEAFPSNVSGGSTTTADMEFVGNNYTHYAVDQQENSYFKEDGFCPVDDNLSLGNLDSNTTLASSIGMGGSMGNIHENKATNFERYQQGDQAQNGQNGGGHHYQSNIKIIEPQHDQSKVNHRRKKPVKDRGGGGGGGSGSSPSQPPISEMGTGDSSGYYK